MADEDPPPAPPPGPPPKVILSAWFPKDAIPAGPDENDEPEPEETSPLPPLDALLSDIPRRLKASAPAVNIKTLEASIAENEAKIEALGEPREDDEKGKEELEALKTANEEAKEKLEGEKAAYETLCEVLCNNKEHSNALLPWVDALMSWADAGVREIIPTADRSYDMEGAKGGRLEHENAEGDDAAPARRVTGSAADVAFDSSDFTPPAMRAKEDPLDALREVFFKYAESEDGAKEKPGLGVVPRFAPNPYLIPDASAPGSDADTDALQGAVAEWVSDQQQRLGSGFVEKGFERVIVAWADDEAKGLHRLVRAMQAIARADPEQKPLSVALENATSLSLRTCRVNGVVPAAAHCPARLVLGPTRRGFLADAKHFGVEVVASDVLFGGLVSRRWLGRAEPVLATLKGTPAFAALAEIRASVGGWAKHQRLLEALDFAADSSAAAAAAAAADEAARETKPSLETVMIRAFVDRGMRVVVETTLDGYPPYDPEAIEAEETFLTEEGAARAYAALYALGDEEDAGADASA